MILWYGPGSSSKKEIKKEYKRNNKEIIIKIKSYFILLCKISGASINRAFNPSSICQ